MTTYEEAVKGIEGWNEVCQKMVKDFMSLTSDKNKELILISLFDEFDEIGQDLGYGAQYHALSGAFAMLNLLRLTKAKTVILFLKKEKMKAWGVNL